MSQFEKLLIEVFFSEELSDKVFNVGLVRWVCERVDEIITRLVHGVLASAMSGCISDVNHKLKAVSE